MRAWRSTSSRSGKSCTKSCSPRRGPASRTKGARMGKESHYSSKKDRVFVRGIAGKYSLTDELQRLRSMPRVVKGRDLLFNDGPQSFSKHFIEPEDGLTQVL